MTDVARRRGSAVDGSLWWLEVVRGSGLGEGKREADVEKKKKRRPPQSIHFSTQRRRLLARQK
jgi:hypothetical protein